MSTTLRIWTLGLLRRLGVRQFRARSGLGCDYICFLEDFIGELPFCNRDLGRAELVLMAAWCQEMPGSPVLDVGGNVGFFATQLAQLTENLGIHVFSFEPSPFTFTHLAQGVRRLGLQDRVHPVCCALSDAPGLVHISYDERDTMRAHLVSAGSQGGPGQTVAWTNCVTLDEVLRSVPTAPSLIKIDVEGHEVRVLRGGHTTLRSPTAPALLVEWNPGALAAAGFCTADLADQLGRFKSFYVNDFEGQRIAFGEPILLSTCIDWECNIFAVPDTDGALQRCVHSFAHAERELAALRAAYR